MKKEILQHITFHFGPLDPPILADADKSLVRGYNHRTLTRFLLPVQHLASFDSDPDGWVFFFKLNACSKSFSIRYRSRLLNGEIVFDGGDYPSFLYDLDSHKPEVLDSGLFRGPLLVSVSTSSLNLKSLGLHVSL